MKDIDIILQRYENCKSDLEKLHRRKRKAEKEVKSIQIDIDILKKQIEVFKWDIFDDLKNVIAQTKNLR